jgi:outer membrane protein assembly factor BamB
VFRSTRVEVLGIALLLGLAMLACGAPSTPIPSTTPPSPGSETPPSPTLSVAAATPASQAASPIVAPTTDGDQPGVVWAMRTIAYYVVSEDKFFDIGPAGLVVAYSLETGQELWRWDGEWETNGVLLAADQDAVYVARWDGRYYALDANTGQERWRVTLHPEYGAPETALQDTATLYLSFEDRTSSDVITTVAIRKINGALLWERPKAIPLLARERVLVVKEGLLPRLSAGVDLATGGTIWQVAGGCPQFLLTEQEVFCWVASVAENMPLSVYDLDSGAKLWQMAETLGDVREVSAASVYISTGIVDQSIVRVFDRHTGQERWPSAAAGFLGEVEGVVVLSQTPSNFTWAIDALTATTLWENGDLLLTGIAGVADRILVGWRPTAFGSSEYFVYGIDFETGERKWRLEGIKATGSLTSPEGKEKPFHIFGDNLIYIVADTLVVLDPQTGETVSSMPLPGAIYDFEPKGDNLLLTGAFCLCEIHLPLASPPATPMTPSPTPYSATSSQYYPMAVGDYWLNRWTNADGQTSYSTLDVIRSHQMGNETVFVVQESTQDGYLETYYAVDTNAVTWHREDLRDEEGALLNTLEPRESSSVLWEIPLEVGQQRHHEWIIDDTYSDGTAQMIRVDRDYVVEIMESVDVPAGHFDGCYRVRTTLSYPGSTRGPQSKHEWLCQGVGLVKSVVLANANDEEQLGQTVELVEYHVE